MATEALAQYASRIGKKALLNGTDVPWDILVEIVDVRVVWGRVQYEVRDGSNAETPPSLRKVWVADYRVRIL